ncbi:MAG: 2-hydroxychromene-2-carboxylate isomerase [Herbaspirillum sp.]
MGKTCEYYFTPQSPFVYLGHARLVEIAARHQASIILKPIDFGKIMTAAGGVPLAKRAPQRQAYRLLELQRWSSYLNIPLNLHPASFPVPDGLAAKAIIASQLAHGSTAALEFAGAVMRAIWAEEKNIADPETLTEIANGLGHEGKDLLKSAETASVQTEYDRCTAEAITANMFGAPWYVVDGIGYWGQDRLEFVERALTD